MTVCRLHRRSCAFVAHFYSSFDSATLSKNVPEAFLQGKKLFIRSKTVVHVVSFSIPERLFKIARAVTSADLMTGGDEIGGGRCGWDLLTWGCMWGGADLSMGFPTFWGVGGP